MVRFGTYQLYTSSNGGNIFFPESTSFCRKRLRSRNSLLTTSSLRCASQLGSKVSISSFKSFFCSSDKVDTHLSLSNLTGGASEDAALGDDDGADEVVVLVVFGAPKNEVRLASFLGFLRSDEEAVRTSALRLSEAIGMEKCRYDRRKPVREVAQIERRTDAVRCSWDIRIATCNCIQSHTSDQFLRVGYGKYIAPAVIRRPQFKLQNALTR